MTKVDFTMAPPRIAPSDYRHGNELTTGRPTLVDTTQAITHDKYCAMTLTFSFQPRRVAPLRAGFHHLPRSVVTRDDTRPRNEFLLGNVLLSGVALSLAISATRYSCQPQDCQSCFLMVKPGNEGFVRNCSVCPFETDGTAWVDLQSLAVT